jgi:UDP-N-acetylglucosamine 1-carboxyvinyltransferase
MDKMAVQQSLGLNGEVHTSGAKNSALPLLFSTLLAEGEHVFSNVPALKDIESTAALLTELGCNVRREKDRVIVGVTTPQTREARYDLVRKMRASILCLGPLLARYGEAKVSLPGGCAIGTRPIDLHLEAMRALGAEVEIEAGYVYAKAKRLVGVPFLFENATVGGTENAMMAAALAEGETILENAAKEPEIVDLANYLNAMGAKITGAGSSIIRIQGVAKLTPTAHAVIPDRIEAGTLVIAGAITGGEVHVRNCRPDHLEALIHKLREIGVEIKTSEGTISVRASRDLSGLPEIAATDVTTTPHPGFPTDLQAQFMALMTQAQGTSVISETVFENRFMHVQELMRLGADITPKARVAVVRGKKGGLAGAPVMATDLRASACLVLAGLVARGETVVNRIYHLDRGYERLEDKLSSLGAKVRRVSE